jgi:hypothetical protein
MKIEQQRIFVKNMVCVTQSLRFGVNYWPIKKNFSVKRWKKNASVQFILITLLWLLLLFETRYLLRDNVDSMSGVALFNLSKVYFKIVKNEKYRVLVNFWLRYDIRFAWKSFKKIRGIRVKYFTWNQQRRKKKNNMDLFKCKMIN